MRSSRRGRTSSDLDRRRWRTSVTLPEVRRRDVEAVGVASLARAAARAQPRGSDRVRGGQGGHRQHEDDAAVGVLAALPTSPCPSSPCRRDGGGRRPWSDRVAAPASWGTAGDPCRPWAGGGRPGSAVGGVGFGGGLGRGLGGRSWRGLGGRPWGGLGCRTGRVGAARLDRRRSAVGVGGCIGRSVGAGCRSVRVSAGWRRGRGGRVRHERGRGARRESGLGDRTVAVGREDGGRPVAPRRARIGLAPLVHPSGGLAVERGEVGVGVGTTATGGGDGEVERWLRPTPPAPSTIVARTRFRMPRLRTSGALA